MVEDVRPDAARDRATRRERVVKQRLDALDIRVDMVVNCAGMGLTKPFADSIEDEVRAQRQLDANCLIRRLAALLPTRATLRITASRPAT